MLISLDYDGTFTRDRELWKRFITDAVNCGHRVICFTKRYPNEVALDIPCEVIYTSRQAKKKFAEESGYQVDIWIDDMPALLFDGLIAKGLG